MNYWLVFTFHWLNILLLRISKYLFYTINNINNMILSLSKKNNMILCLGFNIFCTKISSLKFLNSLKYFYLLVK